MTLNFTPYTLSLEAGTAVTRKSSARTSQLLEQNYCVYVVVPGYSQYYFFDLSTNE